MSVSRLALPLLAVLTCAQPAMSEDQNPFAKWEQLKQTTDPFAKTEDAPKQPSRGLEYFSPRTAEKQTAVETSAGEVRSERLQVSAPAANSMQSSATAVVPLIRSKGPQPGNSADPLAVSTEAKSPVSNGNVTVAAFADNGGSGSIQQTSSDYFDDSKTARPNPFTEFLGGAAAESPVSSTAAVSDALETFDASQFIESGSTTNNSQNPVRANPRVESSTQGPQTPSVTLQWVHHDEFSVGQECRCDLVIENTGRVAVRNVITEAVLPRGLQVVSAKPAPVAQGSSARWTIQELQPGESQTVELVVVPQQQGDVQLNAFVQITGAASSNFSVTQPQVAIKLEGPDAVEIGQQAGYTVHVTNPGTGTARNVVIQAAIPNGLEHREGGLLNIDIGTLNPGELRRARLSLTALTGGRHNLAVRVIADGNLAEDTAQMVSVAEPQLNIGLRGPNARKTGQTCEFELVVVNEGGVDSNNVRTKYRVPDGFEFVEADSGGKFNVDDRTIEWYVGTLEPNRVRQFKVTLQATHAGESKHQAGVISEHGRMTMAEHKTTVQGSAELTLNVATSARQVARGGKSVFEVRIENKGNSSASNVGLSCELPSGLALEESKVSGPSEFIADNGVIIFRSLPTLDPGESAVYLISTVCERTGSHRVRARVASESISEPLIGEATANGVHE